MSWLVLDMETYVPSMRPEAEFQPWALHRPVAISMLEISAKEHTFHEYYGAHDDDEWIAGALRMFDVRGVFADTVVTWSGRRFDIPILALTAARLSERMGPIFAQLEQRYRGDPQKHFDVSDVFGRYGCAPPALADVAACLDIDAKAEMSGGDVRDAYERGELQRISRYCTGDVVTTARVAARIGWSLGLIGPSAREAIDAACNAAAADDNNAE